RSRGNEALISVGGKRCLSRVRSTARRVGDWCLDIPWSLVLGHWSLRLVAVLFVVQTAFAADSWPQVRGPNSSCVNESAKPPLQISPTNLVKWKVDIAWSPSSPVIWDDKIFLTTFDTGHLKTICLDRATGGTIWSGQIKPGKLETFH